MEVFLHLALEVANPNSIQEALFLYLAEHLKQVVLNSSKLFKYQEFLRMGSLLRTVVRSKFELRFSSNPFESFIL